MSLANLGRIVPMVVVVAACASSVVSPPTPAPSSMASAAPSATVATASPEVLSSRPQPTTPNLALLGALPTITVDAATAASLQGVLDGLVSSGAPDAIGAVITTNGTWAGAAGIDGPAGRMALSTDEFNIASVSKPMLAALVMHLADQGRIDLDAPLVTYLPGLAVDANGATVRQALAMRSGLGDSIPGTAERAAANCGHAWSQGEVLATIPKPYAAAGTDYHYSNPTYKLLSYAAERASGTSLERAIADVVEPPDARRLLLQGTEFKPPKPWALPLEGHSGAMALSWFGVGGVLPCLSIATGSLAAAAMASDAPTLARWAWRLFAGEIVAPERVKQMTTVDVQGHGLGIDLLPGYGDDLAFGHGGTQSGYAAFLAVLPTRGIVAVLFVNDGDANVEGDIRQLIGAVAK